ncbi:MAG: hypothetical protein KDB00_09795 [Planctomycetales bacterium]|nr:hypothetical protein [Planctomycetales bacterium]
MLTIKTELTRRMIFVGKGSSIFLPKIFLPKVLLDKKFRRRNAILPRRRPDPGASLLIACDERLGGLLKSYRRAA